MSMGYKKFITSNSKLLQTFGSFVFGLSTGVAVINLLCCFNVLDLNPKKYVYINVEKVIASVNSSLSMQTDKKNISEQEVSEKLTLAKHRFDSLLSDYIKQHNAVIFSSVKAIAGAKDETEYFIEHVLGKVK